MSKPVILLVDDEPGLLRLFGNLLERLDCDLIRAEGGAQALEVLDQVVPDLLILDLAMPEISGLDVLRQILPASHLDPMRIMILTAHGAGRFPQVLTPRIDRWVSKPVSPHEFLATVEDMLAADS